MAEAASGGGRQVLPHQEALDQAILQGVEGQDAEAPPGLQQGLGGAEAGVELVQLVVDEHPQGLERLCRDVRRPLEAITASVEGGR